jgi:hypothetical protein
MAANTGGGFGCEKPGPRTRDPPWNAVRTWSLNLSKVEEAQILENVTQHQFVDFRVYDAGETCLGQVAGLIVAISRVNRDGLILQLLEPMASDHFLNQWLKTEVVDVYGQMHLHLCRGDHRECPARHANPKVKLVHSDFWRSRATSDMSRGVTSGSRRRHHRPQRWLEARHTLLQRRLKRS